MTLGVLDQTPLDASLSYTFSFLEGNYNIITFVNLTMNEEQQRFVRISPRNDVLHPPEYPTILPKTICNDDNDWGSWRINRDLETHEIQEKQKQCRDNRDDLISQVINTIKVPSVPIIPGRDVKEGEEGEERTGLSEESPKKFTCMTNLEREYAKINHYCRDKNKNPLDFTSLAESVCENGSYDLLCADHESFDLKERKGSCPLNDEGVYPGLYMCYEGVSCTPCRFKRLEMERRLHQGFLKNHCDNLLGDEECAEYGYNREKELSYQRGNRFRFYRENDYQERDMKSMAEIIAEQRARERARERRREGIKRINEAIEKINISLDRREFVIDAESKADLYVEKQNPNSWDFSYGTDDKDWVIGFYMNLWQMYWRVYWERYFTKVFSIKQTNTTNNLEKSGRNVAINTSGVQSLRNGTDSVINEIKKSSERVARGRSAYWNTYYNNYYYNYYNFYWNRYYKAFYEPKQEMEF